MPRYKLLVLPENLLTLKESFEKLCEALCDLCETLCNPPGAGLEGYTEFHKDHTELHRVHSNDKYLNIAII